MTEKELIQAAVEMLDKAYVPYSHFPVGAALECGDGTVYTGCNIENASYGATNCAERSAMFSAYSNGVRKQEIQAIAIVADGETIASPCGICRQVMAELLNEDTPVYLSNGKKEMDLTVKDLLPYAFTQEDLK